MRRWLCALLLFVLSVGCSHTSVNTLTGSESQVYDLSFTSVVIVLQGTTVSIKYVGPSGAPAILVVNTANISNVAQSSIDLTQLTSGQPRGVLQNLGGDGNGVENPLPISLGTVTFDQVPKVGAALSGQFNATLTNGFTLNGTFSETVHAP